MDGRCFSCSAKFGLFCREYSCVQCKHSVCSKCHSETVVSALGPAKHRVCNECQASTSKPVEEGRLSPPKFLKDLPEPPAYDESPGARGPGKAPFKRRITDDDIKLRLEALKGQGMHFQSDDEEPGSSESTAERSEREEMLRHFVPVNMLSERTVERMRKMEGRKRQGLVVYYCNECNYATQYKSYLVNHSRTHSGEQPFHCKLCDQKFGQSSSLHHHLLTHKQGQFECKECDYKATLKQHLVTHLLTHSGVKPHKCDSCEFSTARKSSLIVHQRLHSGEKPYSCTRCSYKAAHSSTLTQHMRKHTGIKPYACSECSYQAAQKGTLDSHMLTHSGAKPFSCEHCSFRTAQKSNLNKHLKICKHVPGP